MLNSPSQGGGRWFEPSIAHHHGRARVPDLGVREDHDYVHVVQPDDLLREGNGWRGGTRGRRRRKASRLSISMRPRQCPYNRRPSSHALATEGCYAVVMGSALLLAQGAMVREGYSTNEGGLTRGERELLGAGSESERWDRPRQGHGCDNERGDGRGDPPGPGVGRRGHGGCGISCPTRRGRGVRHLLTRRLRSGTR